METENNLWTYKDLAQFLKVSEAKLRHDNMLGQLPSIKIGRCVRFDPAAIREWLETKTKGA